MISFTVVGRPVPLQRSRTRGGRHYLPARSKAYRSLVQSEWMLAGRPSLGDAPFAASMRFRGLRKNADLDNAVKGVLDALNGLAFTDDHNLACLSGVHRLPLDDGGARCQIDLWPVVV